MRTRFAVAVAGVMVTLNSLCRLAAAALVALETSLSRFAVTAKAVLRLAMGSVTLSALTVHAGVILPDLPVGTQYQLMFMTDETIITTSGVIADYNSFVTTSAVKSPALAGLSAEWRAVASTFDVSANSNALSNGLVFNTAGQQVASPIRSLYSGTSLFAPVNYNQYGDQVAKNMATGSDKFGNKMFFVTQDGGPLGYLTYVQVGNYDGWNNATWLENGSKGGNNAISGRSIYALSSVITVVPEPSTCAMALAGLACGGWQVLKRRCRRSASGISRSLVALLIAACSVIGGTAHAQLTLDMVTVGDPGNTADNMGHGGVAYVFQIAKYETTIDQYAAFMNAVAADDTYGLYDGRMASDLNIAGIERTFSNGRYNYSAIGPAGRNSYNQTAGGRPVTYVSYFDAMRFVNWLSNGQPVGGQESATTENGAYALNGLTSGTVPERNAINPNTGSAPNFFMPVFDEWYKSAFYSAELNGGSGGYWLYAIQSNIQPGTEPGYYGVNYLWGTNYANTSSPYSGEQNYLTDVGQYANSVSYYGTYDQSGSVWEWYDLQLYEGPGNAPTYAGIRGGAWSLGVGDIARTAQETANHAHFGTSSLGFRVVSVPEPSTCAMALAGLACGGYSLFRRRRTR